jgi:hypothetical protein
MRQSPVELLESMIAAAKEDVAKLMPTTAKQT